jgi:hypothetical protein
MIRKVAAIEAHSTTATVKGTSALVIALTEIPH